MDKLARTIAAALKVLNPAGEALTSPQKRAPTETPPQAGNKQ
jgi:hypothetical protein